MEVIYDKLLLQNCLNILQKTHYFYNLKNAYLRNGRDSSMFSAVMERSGNSCLAFFNHFTF